MADKEIDPVELTGERIEEMIYEVRGQKVMLDFQLAEIYGYETKAFNRQVKNNEARFEGDEFMFQLSNEEVDYLSRCKKFTLNKGSGRGTNVKYNPHAFTEQGIYMLMTVLKGDLAVRQSRALIKAFKAMKDYIIENNGLLVNSNPYLESRFASYDRRFEIIEHKIDSIMDNFVDESTYKHFIILDGEKIEADIAYQNIYKKAKNTILIIDDYIDVKTLQLLKASRTNVNITIVTDNKARNSLTEAFVRDSGLSVEYKRNDAKFHDRYIVIDYKTPAEKVYHCGCSSKDAGSRITAISLVNDAEGYYVAFDDVLMRPPYLIGQ